MKVLSIIIISIIIFVLTYMTCNDKKIKKASICSGLAAVLCFVGPYVVDLVENFNRKEEIKGVNNRTDDISTKHVHQSSFEKKENVIDATCTSAGSYELVSYCECGEELGKDTYTTEVLGHDYMSTITEPSCEETGYTTYICSRCRDSYVDDYVNALGHDFVEEICIRCGQTNKTNEDIEYVTFMGETHKPSDIATQVSVNGWINDEDYDIAGQTYDGGIKITIYNMFSALDGNNSSLLNEITSEIHYALNVHAIESLDKEDQRFVGKFVIGKDTDSSPSTATISILLDGEEKYNSGEINCYSLDIEPFDIELSGKKEMIIRIVCQNKGNPLIIGMVNNE